LARLRKTIFDNHNHFVPDEYHDAATETEWYEETVQALRQANMEGQAFKLEQCFNPDVLRYVRTCPKHPDHHHYPIRMVCNLRVCPTCIRIQNQRLYTKYESPVLDTVHQAQMSHPLYSLKHITLTTPYTLRDMTRDKYQTTWARAQKTLNDVNRTVLLKQMPKAARRRGRLDYKMHNIGLLTTAEFGKKHQLLHFHSLFLGPFIPFQMLSETWSKNTNGESKIVEIEEVDGKDKGIRRCLAYVTKGLDCIPPELVPHLLQLIHGSHRVRIGGIFYDFEQDEPQEKCCRVCAAKLVNMQPTKFDKFSKN
jgi:hypothetical protein